MVSLQHEVRSLREAGGAAVLKPHAPSRILGGAGPRRERTTLARTSTAYEWRSTVSVHAISWVLQHSEVTLGDRLVLIALADHASADGRDSFASVATLAREARLSERQVQYSLRALESNGAIVKDGKGPNGTNRYAVIMGGADSAGVQNDAQGVQSTAPEPSLEPNTSLSLVPAASLTAEEPRPLPRARENEQALRTVNRIAVKPEHDTLARQILAEWNAQTGQSLTSRDYLKMLVMRIREKPDLTLEEHAHVIAAALADPWWTNQPSPNVIYGNGRQFDSAIQKARAPAAGPRKQPMRYGRGMTTKQILEAGGLDSRDFIRILEDSQ